MHEFSEEIDRIYAEVSENGAYSASNEILREEQEIADQFKRDLLKSFHNGTTLLASGGYGLEQLVKCLVEMEGYDAKIEGKGTRESGIDIDITASKTDKLSSTRLFIQVKHHRGESDSTGVQQLANVEDDDEAHRLLITTAKTSEEAE